MGVFAGDTKVSRAVADPATDHKLPDSKSLSFRAITRDTALSGTKGQHCNLTHGDEWDELKGTRTENVAVDHKQTVKGDQTIRIWKDHQETIVGNCYQNIIGPHIVQNNNVKNETALGAYTKTFGSFDVQDDHDGHFVYAAVLMSRVYLFDFEFYGSKVEIDLLLMQAMVAALTFGVTQATVSVYQNSLDGVHLTQKFMLQEIKNVASDIAAWASHIGLGEGDMRCIMNACPDIGSGTPFR
jgi:hypothetical protein